MTWIKLASIVVGGGLIALAALVVKDPTLQGSLLVIAGGLLGLPAPELGAKKP